MVNPLLLFPVPPLGSGRSPGYEFRAAARRSFREVLIERLVEMDRAERRDVVPAGNAIGANRGARITRDPRILGEFCRREVCFGRILTSMSTWVQLLLPDLRVARCP